MSWLLSDKVESLLLFMGMLSLSLQLSPWTQRQGAFVAGFVLNQTHRKRQTAIDSWRRTLCTVHLTLFPLLLGLAVGAGARTPQRTGLCLGQHGNTPRLPEEQAPDESNEMGPVQYA